MSKDSSDQNLAQATSAMSLEDTSSSAAAAAAASSSSSSSSSTAASSSPAAASPSSPSDELSVLHPLEHRWTFFYNEPNKASSAGVWSSNVKTVTTFGTVEDFWRLFNALKSPSMLSIGSNYHMFKEGIQPEWEDEKNRKGGKWTMAFPRRSDPAAAKAADDAWLHSLLALIGEQFGGDSDEICGIVIGPRNKETRLALWTRHGEDEQTCKRIGNFFKQNLRYDQPITYQLHDESIKKGTSYRNQTAYQC